MYLKLTRLDNTPIWINAAFIVTIEPRKGGGSVVVPIGDGLDYDVRETTDQVLAMLGDAPAPAVVPVPAPKLLAPTPADVSPDTEPLKDEPPEDEPKPAKRTRRTKKAADGEATKTTRKPRAKKTAEKVAEAEAEPAASVAEPPKVEQEPPKPATSMPVEFTDAQIERLKKMMPHSLRKLVNTLVAQFKVADAESVVAALKDRGTIDVEREHVIWK